LEGAGMVWVGLKQRQTLAWMFGLLVQFGAWLSFLSAATGLDAVAAAQANLWLGFLLLAATAFLMAVNFRQQTTQPGHSYDFASLATAFLAIAAVWMLAGAWTEIVLHQHGEILGTLLVSSGLFVAALLVLIASRLQWAVARQFALWVQSLVGLVFLAVILAHTQWPSGSNPANLWEGPFLGALLISMGALFSSRFFERQAEEALTGLANRLLGAAGFWWFGFVLPALASWLAFWYGWLWPSGHDEFWTSYALLLALSAVLFARLAKLMDWSQLRNLATPVWLGLATSSIFMVFKLYFDVSARQEVWWAYGTLWVVSEWLLWYWQQQAWPVSDIGLKTLHSIRTIGPWLMMWPVGRHWLEAWLAAGSEEERQLLAEAGWSAAGSWSRYLPTWAMMLVLVGLLRRVRSGGWPVAPVMDWYRQVLIPLGTGWSVLLIVIWNLRQNGWMAPLPYLPVLNPLDLTTGFVLLLALTTFRRETGWTKQTLYITGLSAYAWFNLMLLRSVANYLDIPYRFDVLFAAQFVQAMLSLVWSLTALLLMRAAAVRLSRQVWTLGAVLLGIVVAKLFFVDLSDVGGLARIVSFVGVGLLMVAIGYVAPLPNETDK
jgi:hypothetical protein